MASSVQHDVDNVENKGVVAENLPSNNEAIAVDKDTELSHIEEEVRDDFLNNLVYPIFMICFVIISNYIFADLYM